MPLILKTVTMRVPQRKPNKLMTIDELVKKAYKQAGIDTPTQEDQIKNALKATKDTIVRSAPIVRK